MTMMERKFEDAGLSPRDMKLGRYVIEFLNEGGCIEQAHAIVDLVASKKLVRKGQTGDADNGQTQHAQPHQPDEGAGDHKCAADKAKNALSPASSRSCERDGQADDADEAKNEFPPARKAQKPHNLPRGLEAIKTVQATIRRGLMWSRSTQDRRLWATVKWYELHGMRRDGNLADLLLKSGIVQPSNNSATVAEIVPNEIFDKAYYETQSTSDAA